MKLQLKKKRSLWESMSSQSHITIISFLIFIPVFGFGFLTYLFPEVMGLVCVSVVPIFGLYVIGYFAYRSIRASLIIQRLPISKEELTENNITTKLEYLQALYQTLKPFSLDYWYDRFFDDGNENMAKLMEELKKVYYSIEDETIYLLSDKKTDKDAEYIVMFVNGICEYKLHYEYYNKFHKKKKDKEAIVLTKEMLEG